MAKARLMSRPEDFKKLGIRPKAPKDQARNVFSPSRAFSRNSKSPVAHTDFR